MVVLFVMKLSRSVEVECCEPTTTIAAALPDSRNRSARVPSSAMKSASPTFGAATMSTSAMCEVLMTRSCVPLGTWMTGRPVPGSAPMSVPATVVATVAGSAG